VKTARWAVAAAGALATLAPPARADESAAARRAIAAREMDRPYTLAEVEIGLLALPAATVCTVSTTECSQGEGSLAIGIHNLYRIGPFGIGAGIDWATTLRSDKARGAPELERAHTRSYFLVEGQFRYYPFRTSEWEGWAGATIGGVVVSDTWSTLADREPYADTDFIGPRDSSLGTEGFAFGIGAGAEWSFAPAWSVGATLRYSNWLFPQNPKPLPLGDPASLSGRVDMIALLIALAYRIAL
jgi:hypothetical protein